jgi:hypothetical protein
MAKLGPKELGEVSEIADLVFAESTSGSRSDVRLSAHAHLSMHETRGTWYVEGSEFEELEPFGIDYFVGVGHAAEVARGSAEGLYGEVPLAVSCPVFEPATPGQRFQCRVEMPSGTQEVFGFKVDSAKGGLELMTIYP